MLEIKSYMKQYFEESIELGPNTIPDDYEKNWRVCEKNSKLKKIENIHLLRSLYFDRQVQRTRT